MCRLNSIPEIGNSKDSQFCVFRCIKAARQRQKISTKVVELTNAKKQTERREHTRNGGKGETGGDISPRKNSLGIRAKRRNRERKEEPYNTRNASLVAFGIGRLREAM